MDWDAIGAIGEAVGALAVLATLLYLSLQLRGFREEQQRSIQSYRQTTLRDFYLEPVRNPDLGDALIDARTHLGIAPTKPVEALMIGCGLDSKQAMRLASYYLSQCLYRVETIQNLHLLSAEQRENFERQLVVNYTRPGPEKVWFDGFRESSSDMPLFKLLDELVESGKYERRA